MNRRRFFAGLFATACGAPKLFAEPTNEAKKDNAKKANELMDFITKTAGGKQFWADVWFFHDWRIQCHALTGHYRLLDGANHRHVSGTYDECRNKMDEIRKRDKLPPMQGNAVLILHGLFRTRTSMASVGQAVANA